MVNPNKEFFVPRNCDFQPYVGYRDTDKSPAQVARQTHSALELYYHGVVNRPTLLRDYLHDYTLRYLKAAEEGSGILYDRIGQLKAQAEGVDIETREASGHAFVVFALLPDKAKSPYLPKGFSRRGMLQAPITQRQFLERVRELKFGILQVVEGQVEPHTTLEAYPPLLRVFKFFEVGGNLPIKQASSQTEQQTLEREKFNSLLGEIDISL